MIQWLRRILGIEADYERVQRQIKALNERLDGGVSSRQLKVALEEVLAQAKARMEILTSFIEEYRKGYDQICKWYPGLEQDLAALRAQLQQLEVRTLPDAIDRLEAYYKAHPGEHEMYVAGEAVGYTNKGVIRADHSRLAKQGAIEAVGGGVYRRGAA